MQNGCMFVCEFMVMNNTLEIEYWDQNSNLNAEDLSRMRGHSMNVDSWDRKPQLETKCAHASARTCF